MIGISRRNTLPTTMLAVCASVLVAFLVTGWRWDGTRSRARPTPGAPFSYLDVASRSAVLAYARSLEFDTTAGAADSRPLTRPNCAGCDPGPVATIQAEVGSFAVSEHQLAKGRILARIINEGSSTWDRLGLAPKDTVYWWVDSLATGWRSVFIPTASGGKVVVQGFTIERHQQGEWSRAFARWRWNKSLNTEETWATCDGGACCKAPHKPTE